jgi:retinol dehydrogenase 12
VQILHTTLTANFQVFLVTGASTGVGFQLARLLYSRNGTVYLASRSGDKLNAAIDRIRAEHSGSTGTLRVLTIDLEDLSSVRDAARKFLARERHLDVLWHNAGVMVPPTETVTRFSKQGHELQMGVHALATFLLTKLLVPALKAAAQEGGEARVCWVGSSAVELFSPKGGVDVGNLDYKRNEDGRVKYASSKAGMVLNGMEFARQYNADGILSVVSCGEKTMRRWLLMRTLPVHEPWKSQDRTWKAFEPHNSHGLSMD